MKALFPMFVKLEGLTVLVVGAGRVAEGKIRGLLDAGARVRVVALEASDSVLEWARNGEITLELRAFEPGDLEHASLVVAATSIRDLNETTYAEARQRGVWCNVVDVPELCDFYYPAVVRQGDLQIAISTAGQSPSLAQHIRHQLERQFGPAYADWVAELGDTRRAILQSGLEPEEKRELLQSLANRSAFEALLRSKRNGHRGGSE
jgi:precorrin-2 dehydrogenase/sirohydrochlorin ferrochelatase